jgi:hypothetical protein
MIAERSYVKPSAMRVSKRAAKMGLEEGRSEIFVELNATVGMMRKGHFSSSKASFLIVHPLITDHKMDET